VLRPLLLLASRYGLLASYGLCRCPDVSPKRPLKGKAQYGKAKNDCKNMPLFHNAHYRSLSPLLRLPNIFLAA